MNETLSASKHFSMGARGKRKGKKTMLSVFPKRNAGGQSLPIGHLISPMSIEAKGQDTVYPGVQIEAMW